MEEGAWGHCHKKHRKTKAGKGDIFAGAETWRCEGLSASFLHVGSLRTLRSLHNFEIDGISFLQSTVPLANNGRIVNENIRAIVAPNESVPLGVIEPFHGATQA
jgi:hypothetical protein